MPPEYWATSESNNTEHSSNDAALARQRNTLDDAHAVETRASDLILEAKRHGYDLVSRPDHFGEPSIYTQDGAYLANRIRSQTKRPLIAFVPLESSEAAQILAEELRRGATYEAFFKTMPSREQSGATG
jgi:hypothetical protein